MYIAIIFRKFLVLRTLMPIGSIYCKVDVIRVSIQNMKEGNYMKLIVLSCKLKSIKAQFAPSTCVLFVHLSLQYQVCSTFSYNISKNLNIDSS